MNKEEIASFLDKTESWSKDRYGNWVRSLRLIDKSDGSVFERYVRIKFKEILARIETKRVGQQSWTRIQSTYYRDIFLLPDGKLRIGRFTIGGKLK